MFWLQNNKCEFLVKKLFKFILNKHLFYDVLKEEISLEDIEVDMDKKMCIVQKMSLDPNCFNNDLLMNTTMTNSNTMLNNNDMLDNNIPIVSEILVEKISVQLPTNMFNFWSGDIMSNGWKSLLPGFMQTSNSANLEKENDLLISNCKVNIGKVYIQIDLPLISSLDIKSRNDNSTDNSINVQSPTDHAENTFSTPKSMINFVRNVLLRTSISFEEIVVDIGNFLPIFKNLAKPYYNHFNIIDHSKRRNLSKTIKVNKSCCFLYFTCRSTIVIDFNSKNGNFIEA